MIHRKFKIAKMSANQSILDDLILHISPDSNGQIPNMASRKPIAGIMGVISLMSGPYLVFITKKARIGALQVLSIYTTQV